MNQSLRTFSVFISLFFILLYGCRQSTFTTVGMVELPQVRLPVEDHVEKMSFKAELRTSRGQFSGIMVIKRVPQDTVKVAFFSEMGMSYLEGSLVGDYPHVFKVRSINPFINDKKTLGYVKTALNILMVKRMDLREGGIYKDGGMNYWIVGESTAGDQYWARLNGDGRVDKAYFDKARQLEVKFEYANDDYPYTVEVFRKDRLFLRLIVL